MESKSQKYRQLIDKQIEILTILVQSVPKDDNSERDIISKVETTARDLELVLVRYGLTLNNVSKLIELIIDTKNHRVLRNSLKAQLIRLLYPVDVVSNDIIKNVIGSIGFNILRSSKNFIHKNLQIKLLKWVYLNIGINNIENMYLLRKLAPVLFNLLDVEYAVQWISLIIFKIFMESHNNKTFMRSMIRQWRIDVLVELNEKLNNQYLLALIIFCQDFNGEEFQMSKLIRDKKISSIIFKYPSYQYLNTMILIRSLMGVRLSLDDYFIENLALSLQNFESYRKLINDKKRKLHLDESHAELTSIIDVIDDKDTLSMSDLIDQYITSARPVQLGLIILKFSNLYEKILKIDEIDIKTIDVGVYRYLFSISDIWDDLDEWCEIVLVKDGQLLINNENLPLVQRLVDGMMNIQLLLAKPLKFTYKVLNDAISVINETDTDVINKIEFLKLIPLNSQFIDIIDKVHWQKDTKAACKFLQVVIQLIQNTPGHYQIKNQIYLKIFPQIPQIIMTNNSIVAIELEAMNLLRTMELIPFLELNISNVILDPCNCYLALLSNNPMVLSEFCKHVVFSKRYFAEYYTILLNESDDSGKEKYGYYKDLHNSYVMDICNLLWRDKLFESSKDSSAKGLLLPAKFISNLSNVMMMTTSISWENDLRMEDFFKESFSLMTNPLFSSLLLKIIRDKEDKLNCDIRYVGPIEETNFDSFVQELIDNNDMDKWLGITRFNEFKLMLLQELDLTNFNGVSSLLFCSLKSLLNKRKAL